MDLRTWVKQIAPEFMVPFLRAGYRFARTRMSGPTRYRYGDRMRDELAFFTACPNAQDLPEIAHYWSNKFLVPMLRPLGFTNAIEMVRPCIVDACRANPAEICYCASIGSGDGQAEIDIAQWLLQQGCRNFHIECFDANADALDRGQNLTREKGLGEHVRFESFDINFWSPQRRYRNIIAFQSLHHVVELERLFETIRRCLEPGGHFLADDMVGRNGHQRWPEALHIIEELWKQLPQRYKYNHQMGRIIDPFENYDCSTSGFEGIRAQDVLPLLVRSFHFEIFAGFGNLIDVFIDRGYGHNFDPSNPEDTAFIDSVHMLDMEHLESGRLKPTHMMAVMSTDKNRPQSVFKHLTPEFCIRASD